MLPKLIVLLILVAMIMLLAVLYNMADTWKQTHHAVKDPIKH